MLICPNCGFRERDGATYCRRCGYTISKGRYLSNKSKSSGLKIGIVVCIALIAILSGILTILVLNLHSASVASDSGKSVEQILFKEIEIATPEIVEENYSKHLKVDISIPDYSSYLANCFEEIEKSTSSTEDFEEKLYAILTQKSNSIAKNDTYELDINLSERYPEKEKWSEQELNDLAAREAFNKELEEFAMFYMAQFSPLLEEETP